MAIPSFSPQDPKAWQRALMEKPEQAIAEYQNVFTAQQDKLSELDAKIQQLRATLEQKKQGFARVEIHAKGPAQQHKAQKSWCTLRHAIGALAAQSLQSDTTLFQGIYQDFEELSTLFTHVVEEQWIPSLEQQARTYQAQLAHVTRLEKQIALVDRQTKTLESTIAAQTRLHAQTSQQTNLAKKGS